MGYMPEEEIDVEYMRFQQSQERRAVRKPCLGCGDVVEIPPEYGYCDSCADRRELGLELG